MRVPPSPPEQPAARSGPIDNDSEQPAARGRRSPAFCWATSCCR